MPIQTKCALRCCLTLLLGAFSPQLSHAQDGLVPLSGVNGTSSNKQQIEIHHQKLMAEQPSAFRPQTVTFVGDVVYPHFIDGASFQTTVTLANLDSKKVHFQVLFFNDDGTDLAVPIVGFSGLQRGLDVTLGIHGTLSFSTAGTSADYRSGWALMSLDNSNDSVTGFSVFRQRVAGRPDFEATVPVVSQFQGHFVIPYDETNGYFTGIALANPTPYRVSIPVTIYDDAGNALSAPATALQGYGHAAFLIRDLWPVTAGRRGTIEVRASGFGVAALGLRFNPGGAFTSFNTMENFAWLIQ